jgi:hypothetical protein
MIRFIKNKLVPFDLNKFDFSFDKLELTEEHPYFHLGEKTNDVSVQTRVWHENLPDEIMDYIHEFGFKKDSFCANLTVQHPGSMTPVHIDKYVRCASILKIKPEEITRILIFLTDWEIVQTFGVENGCLLEWKAGDCYTFDELDEHWTVNAGVGTRYTLLISTRKDSIIDV